MADEREILRLIADGLSTTEIGEQLYIGETIKTHVARIFHKLNLRGRVQMGALAPLNAFDALPSFM